MRIVCWNVNSWPPTARNAATSVTSSAPSKTSSSSLAASKNVSAALAQWIGDVVGADLLCLQETKVSEPKLADLKELAVVPGYESFWSCSGPPRTGYSGVATYARSPRWSPTSAATDEVLPSIHAFEHLPGGDAAVEALDPSTPASPTYLGEGRYLEVSLGDDVTIINVYVPNAGDREADGGLRAGVKAAFLRAVRRRVDEILGSGGVSRRAPAVIVCGDINLAPSRRDVHPSIDYDQLYSREELDALRDLMAPPLSDAFRSFHGDRERHAGCPPGKRGFTVWDQRTSARARGDVGLRIDLFLVSEELRVTRCDVLSWVPWSWSDHAPVVLEVEEAREGAEAGGSGGAGGAGARAAAVDVVAEAAPPSSPRPPLLVRPPPPHEPIPQSSLRHPRWQPDRRQPTILALFGKKRAADEGKAKEEAQKRAKGSGGGGGNEGEKK